MSEKYIYCWEGCYDEKTDYIVVMVPKIINGVEYNHCPKCVRTWPLDWVQMKGTPPQFKQRSISKYIRYKEQNPELFEDS